VTSRNRTSRIPETNREGRTPSGLAARRARRTVSLDRHRNDVAAGETDVEERIGSDVIFIGVDGVGVGGEVFRVDADVLRLGGPSHRVGGEVNFVGVDAFGVGGEVICVDADVLASRTVAFASAAR
jgi:hypothetical protein